MSTLDRVKFATIDKNYGISLSQAKLLCQKYGFNIERIQETVVNKKIHTLLKDLTQIITAEEALCSWAKAIAVVNPYRIAMRLEKEYRKNWQNIFGID